MPRRPLRTSSPERPAPLATARPATTAATDDEVFALYSAVRMVQRGMKMARYDHALPRLLRNLAESDLEAILVIGEQGSCTAGHLAATLGVAPTTGTTIADRLVARRLVTRRRSTQDRRSVWLGLTTPGRRALEAVRTDQMERCRLLMESLDPAQREQMINLLRLAARSGAAR